MVRLAAEKLSGSNEVFVELLRESGSKDELNAETLRTQRKNEGTRTQEIEQEGPDASSARRREEHELYGGEGESEGGPVSVGGGGEDSGGSGGSAERYGDAADGGDATRDGGGGSRR